MSGRFCFSFAALSVALAALLALAALPFAVSQAAEKKDKLVHDLMEDIHEGKDSPLAQIKSQIDSNAPDWAAVEKLMPLLGKMSKAITESPVAEIKDSSKNYAGAAKALAEAARNQNHPSAKKSLDSLLKSCADCHFKGGVGGELKD
jgi:cytochrome c553